MREKVLEILQGIRPDIDFESEEGIVEDGLISSFEIIKIITKLMK